MTETERLEKLIIKIGIDYKTARKLFELRQRYLEEH